VSQARHQRCKLCRMEILDAHKPACPRNCKNEMLLAEPILGCVDPGGLKKPATPGLPRLAVTQPVSEKATPRRQVGWTVAEGTRTSP
jgi:hypothetical protein